MICTSAELYEGRGQVYLAVRAANGTLGAWEPIAEARSLEIAITQDFEDVYSRCDPNSGQIAHILRQTDYEVTLDTLDMSVDTIAKAVYGAVSSVATGSVTNEAHTFTGVGDSVSLAHPFNTTAVVLKQGATTVDPSDYAFDAQGNVQLLDVSALTGPAPYNLTISYTHGIYEKVEAAVNGLTNYALRFDGISIVDNRPVQVVMHNIALNMSSALSFISEDVGSLTLTGKLLADRTKGLGKSQYFTVAKGKDSI